MGRVKGKQSSGAQSWQAFIAERIRNKKVVPLISNRMAADLVLNGYDKLLDAYVEYVEDVRGDDDDFRIERQSLSQMLQFRNVADPVIRKRRDPLTIKLDFINFIKNRLYDLAETDGTDPDILENIDEKFDDLSLTEFADQLGYPRFQGERDPYLLLASFDLPIYITTSAHDFMEQALRRNGKTPRSEICRWKPDLDTIPSELDADYDPGDERYQNEPLVYHLYGSDRYPESLVLTEDDYMQFLVATSQNVGRKTDAVYWRVRQAMSDSSLLLLGYHLETWELRSLFWGLIVPRTQKLAGAVNIQLEPSKLERLYLERYMDEYHQLEVYWGNVETALWEIRQTL